MQVARKRSIAQWLVLQPTGGAALSDEQICAEIATVIIAGYETTAK